MATLSLRASLLLLVGAVVGKPCCSWNKCGECGSTTSYCETNQADCEQCGGQWCPNGAAGASGYDIKSACDAGTPTTKQFAYACMDWNVGSGAMISAAASAGMNDTHLFGVGSFGADATNMGKCFEITLQGLPRKGLFQVVNQGGDMSKNQFDLQMGDGGFGLFNGCVAPTTKGAPPLFSGPKSAFGPQYGGWTSKADCAKLPEKPTALAALPAGEPSLPRLCELAFELGIRIEGGVNPVITASSHVPCPASLIALTGVKRTDDPPAAAGAGSGSVVTANGMLTRMMDCCKPSAGWIGNVINADPVHPAVIPCSSDGYTRVAVGPAPAPGPAPGPPAPTPTPATPTPAPAPSACPGGSLSACIGLCPSNPPAAYKACIEECTERCN